MKKNTYKNHTGQRQGMLLAIRRTEFQKNDRFLWEYLCDCGKTRNLHPSHAKLQGHCGCLNAKRFEATSIRNTKHGKYGSGSYKSWIAMKSRCSNPKHPAYSKYAKIGFCGEWAKFENFYRDMGDRPERMTLDRIDNSKGYSPDNCRWATYKEQRQNGCNNRIVEGKPLIEIARKLGMSPETLRHRLKRGWSEHDAITIPIQSKYSNAKKS